ncbi:MULTISPECIES: DUF5929 domain-containing protein [unclassified Myroides]|uniref:DUF5929 domain-containing protein n=1 Tax=unclassified Myroides TaxID=2642485 RepID=UPI0015FAA6DF|nr:MULTISPECIES: DUF5929 domain-containing protein [unclassified Myroides]MBB1150940.1 ATP-binding protein [Myroides sp. NP-2]MDM1406830.1 ATP-binding protein [Myroides sp. DF42-4-2]
MINKRLLIKNLLAQYDENSFYDKKRQLNLHTKSGKAKFLKHICALSNSNPENNSFIIVGVEDNANELVGVDFYDDSKIQNLVNAYFANPPSITYDNVTFTDLAEDKVIGLVTISPNAALTTFKRSIGEIVEGTYFSRVGSTSVPNDVLIYNGNKSDVESIEKSSQNNLKDVLDSVVRYMMQSSKEMHANYKVFKEQFVICWVGKKTTIRGIPFYSRMDIEFVNEQIKLFYSSLDVVTLFYDTESFVLTEYLNLGLNDGTSYYPFEEVRLVFYDNGSYDMESKMLFEPPKYNENILGHIYRNSVKVMNKLKQGERLTNKEERVLNKLCYNMMLCYLNGFEQAKEQLIEVKDYLKFANDPELFIGFKQVMRILRKLKYETESYE